MARKATEAEKTPAKAEREKPKYGVNELAEEVGIAPASVRVALRALGVEKNFGNQYGWNTKSDFLEVVKALKERNAKSAIKAQTEGAKAEKEKPSTRRRKKAA